MVNGEKQDLPCTLLSNFQDWHPVIPDWSWWRGWGGEHTGETRSEGILLIPQEGDLSAWFLYLLKAVL